MAKNKIITPSIPRGASAQAQLEAVIEALEVREGKRGDALDSFVTYRDLVNKGMVATKRNIIKDIERDTESVDVLDPDVVPVKPTGFSAAGAIEKVILEWDDPRAVFRYYAFTEIFRNTVDNLGDSTLVGTSKSPVYADNVRGYRTYYYWIRHVNTNNRSGQFNATAGTQASTSKVGESDLSDTAVTASKIADGSILSSKIEDFAVGSTQLADTAVLTSKLATGAVSTNKMADLAVAASKLADSSVESTKIANAAVGNAAIANAAVGNAHIADAAITNAKIKKWLLGKSGTSFPSDPEDSELFFRTDENICYRYDASNTKWVTVDMINESGQITNGIITSTKIVDAAITNAKIAEAAIGSAAIQDAAIKNAAIADLAVDTAKIADASIVDAKISDLSATKINAGSLKSLGWSTSAGVKFDLEANNGNGALWMGGSSDPAFYWNGSNLSIVGSVTITEGDGATNLDDGPAESGADVTTDHAGDIVYQGSSAPAHKAGRIWHDTGTDEFKRSDGAAWTKVSDITSVWETFSTESDIDVLSTTNAPSQSGADVTADHADSIVYQGSTAPSHKAGRIWYDTDNSAFKRSDGSSWNTVSDITSVWETFSAESDINVLGTTNAPAESGADVTGNNTAAGIANQGALATSDNVDYDSEVLNAPVKHISKNSYDETADASQYSSSDKVSKLVFEIDDTGLSWPEAYGGVITYWYASDRATQICFGTSGKNEHVREVHPATYPSWSSWVSRDVFSSSDVDALLTQNAPAESGADVTGNNTANDTSNVNGVPAGNVSGWADSNDTTKINGGQIYVGSSIQIGNVDGSSDYCLIDQGDIEFYRYINGAHRQTKSLKRIDHGICSSGTEQILSGYWKSSPIVHVSPNQLQSYETSYSDADQEFNCYVEDVYETSNVGEYAFVANGELQIASAKRTHNVDDGGMYDDCNTPSSWTTYHATSTYTTDDATVEITVSGYIWNGTGTTDDTYYNRANIYIDGSSVDTISLVTGGASAETKNFTRSYSVSQGSHDLKIYFQHHEADCFDYEGQLDHYVEKLGSQTKLADGNLLYLAIGE